ncbi:metal-sensitive transcriptional regulator [Microbacterium oleivorans]|uniref:metal-sensitive transcriptional regulator n=1 Tax=Microbacterium TaxID=33882 RepID=UPI00203A6822|nr:metal-sensitive transcriptional regulator [Microbacterium oleivorans]MCM3694972.1 metal-sensitive transcriptional regulator [Microbacterium oleivorans]
MSTALHDEDAVRRIANRLKRAQGQLAAVIAAIEEGGDCREVVTQLSAVSGAIDRAGFAVIAAAMQQCVEDDDSELRMAELEKLFLSLS